MRIAMKKVIMVLLACFSMHSLAAMAAEEEAAMAAMPDQQFAANVWLYRATKADDLPEVEAALAAGADPAWGQGEVPAVRALFDTIKLNKSVRWKALLEAGVNPDCTDSHRFGFSPLHYAARFDCPNAVPDLLAHGATLNLVSIYGRTPLYVAVMNSYIAVVAELLAHNADVTVGAHGVSLLQHLDDPENQAFALPEDQEIRQMLVAAGAPQ